MICQKCNNPGVLNSANGNDFYYCRSCKDEITLEAVSDLEIITAYEPFILNYSSDDLELEEI